MGGILALLVIVILAIHWVLASCIRIVPQAYADCAGTPWCYTVQHGVLEFILRCLLLSVLPERVNLKEQVVDFPPQPVITKDNVTMQIDTVVFFQITDPKLLCLWCGESDHGDREPVCNHTAKYHR